MSDRIALLVNLKILVSSEDNALVFANMNSEDIFYMLCHEIMRMIGKESEE
jgi:hypothetical protein